jgi:uncharacterized membrane protein HdeD (DUF308 family)
LYETLPYLYIIAGAAAMLLSFSLDRSPRGLLLVMGLVSLTAGLVLWMRRRDYRAARREYNARALDE